MKGDAAVTPDRVGLRVGTLGVLLAAASLGLASAAEIGSLQKAGLHAVGFRQADAFFVVQATGGWGGYQDYRPRGVPAGAEKLLQLISVGSEWRETWSLASPYGDHWSARWTATLRAPAEGDYTFYYTSDDGARMWIGDKQIVNDWIPRSGLTSEAKVHLAAGDHPVRCEFFEQGGGAQAHLEWAGPNLARQVVPASATTADGRPGWKAEYFLNEDLRGNPTVTQEEKIDFNWGDGGPSVFESGPPTIILEWLRLTDEVVLGRVQAPAKAYAGLLVYAMPAPTIGFQVIGGELQAVYRLEDGGNVPRFRLRALNAKAAYGCSNPAEPPGAWAPGEEPLVFMAGLGRLPNLDAATMARVQRALGGKP